MAEPIAPMEDCPKCKGEHLHYTAIRGAHSDNAVVYTCELCNGAGKWDPAPNLRHQVEAAWRAIHELRHHADPRYPINGKFD